MRRVVASAELVPTLDAPAARRQLVAFLGSYAADARAEGFVLGLSGGVDSAVCAALAAEAVGPDRVLGLILPHRESDPLDAAHARLVAAAFGVPTETIDVSGVVDAAAAACAAHSPGGMAAANLKPRARMIVLYAHANVLHRLVLGTGNKSELLTGYFTKYGDGGADAYPIGDLYKTQVWALARELGVPREVVEKPPSAGLYAGQTDEGEMGVSYGDLDRVLAGFESGYGVADVARLARVPLATVRLVESRVIASAHKRLSLVVPKVGFRTPGLDWREPRHRAPEVA